MTTESFGTSFFTDYQSLQTQQSSQASLPKYGQPPAFSSQNETLSSKSDTIQTQINSLRQKLRSMEQSDPNSVEYANLRSKVDFMQNRIDQLHQEQVVLKLTESVEEDPDIISYKDYIQEKQSQDSSEMQPQQSHTDFNVHANVEKATKAFASESAVKHYPYSIQTNESHSVSASPTDSISVSPRFSPSMSSHDSLSPAQVTYSNNDGNLHLLSREQYQTNVSTQQFQPIEDSEKPLQTPENTTGYFSQYSPTRIPGMAGVVTHTQMPTLSKSDNNSNTQENDSSNSPVFPSSTSTANSDQRTFGHSSAIQSSYGSKVTPAFTSSSSVSATPSQPLSSLHSSIPPISITSANNSSQFCQPSETSQFNTQSSSSPSFLVTHIQNSSYSQSNTPLNEFHHSPDAVFYGQRASGSQVPNFRMNYQQNPPLHPMAPNSQSSTLEPPLSLRSSLTLPQIQIQPQVPPRKSTQFSSSFSASPILSEDLISPVNNVTRYGSTSALEFGSLIASPTSAQKIAVPFDNQIPLRRNENTLNPKVEQLQLQLQQQQQKLQQTQQQLHQLQQLHQQSSFAELSRPISASQNHTLSPPKQSQTQSQTLPASQMQSQPQMQTQPLPLPLLPPPPPQTLKALSSQNNNRTPTKLKPPPPPPPNSLIIPSPTISQISPQVLPQFPQSLSTTESIQLQNPINDSKPTSWRDICFTFASKEREYVNYLSLFSKVYVQTIKSKFPFETSAPELRAILTQLALVDTLLQTHCNDFAVFYKKPIDKITIEDFCNSFLRFPSNVGAYNSFCRNEDEIIAKIEQQKRTSQLFADCLSTCQSQCNGLCIELLIAIPFRHIMTYKEYINKTGALFPRDSSEFKQLGKVYVQLSSHIKAVVDVKWAAETTAKIERMLSTIDGLAYVGLQLNTRRFIIDGEISVVNHGKVQKRAFYVFNNLIIYCKPGSNARFKFGGMFEMDSFVIEDETNTKNLPSVHVLKLVASCVGKKKRKKTIQLCFDSAGEKSIWQKTLLDAQTRFKSPKGDNDTTLLTALLDPNTIQIGEVVGEGAVGIVHRGLYCGERMVAVKKIKNVALLSQSEKDAFVSEVQIMKTFQCPQIIEFIGCVVSADNLWSVTEYISMGTLKDYLTKATHVSVQFKVLLMLDIARGIEYLHKHSIMHRDIKSDNVLVDNVSLTSLTRVKLTDFGASRVVKDKTERNYTRIGTPIYVSPEVLKGESYSFSTDVFSFAILMWEVMSQVEPYNNLPDSLAISHFVLSGKRLPVPEITPKDISALIKKCWENNPKNRPDFTKIVHVLYQYLFSSK